jgi:hypothetical protein
VLCRGEEEGGEGEEGRGCGGVRVKGEGRCGPGFWFHDGATDNTRYTGVKVGNGAHGVRFIL